jgi:glycine/D-amino acid oxidase-like deaminating enzyme
MATNDPGPGCGALRRHVRIRETYMVATPPLEAPLLRAFGSPDVVTREAALRDETVPPHVLRHTKDGRILFQGGDQKPVADRLREQTIRQRTMELMYELSLRYPAISGVMPEYGWSATTVTATDGLLLAGPHRNFPRHLFAIGLGATGLAGAFLAAQILLRHYEESADTTDELFGFSRVQPVRS